MLFGEIADGQMKLNEFGEIVRAEWERTAIVRPNVELGVYVIMPNHVHGILIFVEDAVGVQVLGRAAWIATRGSTNRNSSYNGHASRSHRIRLNPCIRDEVR